jgi:hypothetical protein
MNSIEARRLADDIESLLGIAEREAGVGWRAAIEFGAGRHLTDDEFRNFLVQYPPAVFNQWADRHERIVRNSKGG